MKVKLVAFSFCSWLGLQIVSSSVLAQIPSSYLTGLLADIGKDVAGKLLTYFSKHADMPRSDIDKENARNLYHTLKELDKYHDAYLSDIRFYGSALDGKVPKSLASARLKPSAEHVIELLARVQKSMKALEDTLELGDKSSGDTTLAGIINDYANGRGLKSRSILDGITYDRLTRSDIDWLIKQTEENNKKLKASLTGLKKFFQDHWKIGELA